MYRVEVKNFVINNGLDNKNIYPLNNITEHIKKCFEY